MTRALRFIAATFVVATAGLTVAQTTQTPMTTPGQSPSTPTPSPSMPTQSSSMPTTASQTIPAGQSTWKSQDGSVVGITIDGTTGALTGTFTPGFPCGTSTTGTAATNPIVGTVNGNAVAWALTLSTCPSVGTWIGHYQVADGEQQLTMLWTLAMPDNPPGVGSIFSGSSLFVRQTAP